MKFDVVVHPVHGLSRGGSKSRADAGIGFCDDGLVDAFPALGRLYITLMFGLMLISLTLPTPSHGQSTSTDIPTQVEQGRDLVPGQTEPLPDTDLIMPTFSVDLPEGRVAPEGTNDELVDVTDIKIVGVKAYPAGTFDDLIAPLRGTEATFGALYDVAETIHQTYLDDGYFLSYAFFPSQSVDEGVFTLKVVEGWVEELNFGAFEGRSVDKLRRLLAPITDEKPASLSTVERALLLADDMPGHTVGGELSPIEDGEGAHLLSVSVTYESFEVAVGMDNRSSKFAGPWRGFVDAQINSPLGLGSFGRFSGSITTVAEEERSGSIDIGFPLMDNGFAVQVSASYTASQPGSTLSAFDVGTDTTTVRVGLSYPIVRAVGGTLTASVGANAVQAFSRSGDSDNFVDEVRSVDASLTFTESGFLNGATRLSLGVEKSLSMLGATNQNDDFPQSRFDGDPWATRFVFDFVRAQRLYGEFSALFQIVGQYSAEGLPSSEEFSIGGARFGRAFDSGEVAGDHGIAGSVELRYVFREQTSWLKEFEPYGFYDHGSIWNIEEIAEEPTSETLVSAGAGARFLVNLGTPDVDLTGFIEYARPLNRPRESEDPKYSPRWLSGFSLRY